MDVVRRRGIEGSTVLEPGGGVGSIQLELLKEGAARSTVVELSPGYSNSVVATAPALRPLTDLYALPAAFPLANVFSVGDVLIGIGVAATIAFAMRARRPASTGA